MNEKILPDDIESKSLSELTDIVNRLIQQLENKKNLEETIDDYQYLIKLNNIIEKKFQKDSKNITESTKLKIKELTSKK
ncbi:exonuclease VII small subunit [Candidatus Pelagibacter sp.]|nr:exonuclease VII small subunit [Candidatus Pelagibacter sp.]